MIDPNTPTSGSPRSDADASDPDAVGLPPGTVLPDRRAFRRNQLFAMMVTNAVALVVLVLWWASQPQSSVARACVIAVAVLLGISVARWLWARR